MPPEAPFCFARRRPRPLPRWMAAGLPDPEASALAALLPLLGCGEEAASLGFAAMAGHRRLPATAAAALTGIAADEDRHDQLIKGLQAALPAPGDQGKMLDAARAMHVRLGRTMVSGRLARVAGLDSAVCLILARTLRGRRLPSASHAAAVLRHIHADEARHVAISSQLAAQLGDRRRLADEAAHARGLLAAIVPYVAPAFDALGVDPDRLTMDLARLPDGLFAA
jgi:hypothetical protein